MTNTTPPDITAGDGDGVESGRRRSSLWRELPVLIVVAVLVAIVVRVFVLQSFYIPSGSMEHTLEINDRVLVNKLIYDFRAPHRGEVIVFRSPVTWRSDPAEVDFTKRVIGVGGDRVACCDEHDRLTVNGYPLDETYLFRDQNGVQDPPSEAPFDVRVPAGRLWVMGDHRSASGDSRERYLATHEVRGSTIPDSSVVGKAFVRYWPAGRMGWLTVPASYDGVPPPAGG